MSSAPGGVPRAGSPLAGNRRGVAGDDRGERVLALSASTLRGVDRATVVGAAGAAGFAAVGLRVDPGDDGGDPRHLAKVLDASGVWALDLEVVRIQPGDDADETRRLVAWGHAVGARYLVVVSDDPDRSRTVARFAETSALAAEGAMTAVLEFMRFTAVETLEDALWVLRASEARGAGVLVDALHLARSGDRPEALAGLDPALLPYAQICDAPAPSPNTVDALADEARHHRLVPGEGALALGLLLEALPPATPLSVEVLSDAWEGQPPAEVAQVLMAATCRVLAGPGLG